MSRILLLGTGNQDKLRELRALLQDLPWEVKGLGDYPPASEPEETGASFEENALLKARYYSELFGVPCAADDSGLEVDALDGAPGVYSARYAGPGCSYEDNNEKLLDALAERHWHERTARFVCCAAFVQEGAPDFVARGEIPGHIAADAYGENGFGYDPIFVPENETRTFAEMSASEKNALSHRGRAFAKLRAHLESLA